MWPGTRSVNTAHHIYPAFAESPTRKGGDEREGNPAALPYGISRRESGLLFPGETQGAFDEIITEQKGVETSEK